MKVSLVAALAENGVIGANGGLPWSLPDDMRRFVSLTTGHCVVMGRKTFESMNRRPLRRRTNIVLSRSEAAAGDAKGVHVVSDLTAALAIARDQGDDEAFVIGGEAIYALALPQADCLYLTRVHARVEGEVHFPTFDESAWTLARTEHHDVDARHAYAFHFEDWVRSPAAGREPPAGRGSAPKHTRSQREPGP
jgi:dihydrofolate reductase